MRGMKDPAEPSHDERARHELTHVPFRPWCRHCVSGKAADDPHQRRHERREEPEVAKASIDYGSSGSTARRRTASSWSSRRHRVGWWAPGA